MTDEEQRKIIADVGMELGELRRKRACLLAKADKFLQEVRGAEKTLAEQLSKEAARSSPRGPSLDGWPSFHDISGVVGDLRDAEERILCLEDHCRELGIIE